MIYGIVYNLMVAYLSNDRLNTMTRGERICELEGLSYLLNPCTRLDTWLHPGLDPGVRSSLEYKYSVSQLPPGDYRYVKWWDGWQILRASPRRKEESGNTQVAPKGAHPVFPAFPIFLVFPTSPSSIFQWCDCLSSEGNQKFRESRKYRMSAFRRHLSVSTFFLLPRPGPHNLITIPPLNIALIPWQRLGYTVLLFQTWYHSRVQSRIQSCVKSCAEVKKIL